ncbi:hypothetical protein [Acidisphaera sp. L21]|nr:hypothetical protein [Acidisphaera sp. L21]
MDTGLDWEESFSDVDQPVAAEQDKPAGWITTAVAITAGVLVLIVLYTY